MEIVYPPVGIAHITGQIPDLIADRMTAASRVRVACAMQPKAAPHFGTGIVIMTAFALARLFQDTFGKPATVLLDMLDNAPARTTVIDGIEYSLCLSHAIDGGPQRGGNQYRAGQAARRMGIAAGRDRIRATPLQPDPGPAGIPARPGGHPVPPRGVRAAVQPIRAPAPRPPGVPALRPGRQGRAHRPGPAGQRAEPRCSGAGITAARPSTWTIPQP